MTKVTWNYPESFNGYFGYYDGNEIKIFKYWWMPKFFYKFVLKHEKGHANGIPGSGCIGNHKWCIMAEETMVGYKDDSILGKAILWIYQIFGLGRYCKECKKYIN